MNTKLIAGVAFGFGVLVGWAVTADIYKIKLEEKKATNTTLREMLRRSNEARMELISNDPQLRIENSIAPMSAGVYADDALLILPLDDENSPEEGSVQEDVKEEDGGDAEDKEDDGVESAETKSRLRDLIEHYEGDPDVVDSFVHMAGQTLVLDNTPPFVIPRETFALDDDEGDYFDKITITYYPQYRIMLDDSEEILEDVANIIGWKNLAQFGGESGDPDIVFIRNRRLMTDFEVVREEDSPLPLHVKYGMGREEFETNKASGLLRLRDEDL